jgi:hypothetical protein
MKIFIELPPKTPLNSVHRFFGMELEHTKLFLGLSSHFNAKSTVPLLVAHLVEVSFLYAVYSVLNI